MSMTFRRLTRDTITAQDYAELRRVLFGAPAFSLAVRGRLPLESDVDELLDDMPPDRSSDDKFAFAIEVDGRMVGCADVLRGWRHARQSMIGLLLFDEEVQGRGYGREAVRIIEDIARGWTGMESLRVGVNASNPGAHAFWQRMGFAENGERYMLPDFISEAIIMEKPLA